MKTAWKVVGLVMASALTLVSIFFARVVFEIVSCGAIDDTGGPFPARDSAQGRLCDRGPGDDIWLPHNPATWAIAVAGVVALALVVVAWRRGNAFARVGSVVGVVALPLLLVVPLTMPADTCTREERRAPGSDCATSQ